jgi:lysophospholipase L1-like esterase
MPVNLPSMPALSSRDLERSRGMLKHGTALLDAGDLAAAAQTLEEAAKINPYDGEIFAALGTVSAQRKDRVSARGAWARAKDCEAYRCRERGDRYNRIMEQVARSENVPLVDVVSLFSRYAASHNVYLFNDPKNDPIHPTPLGHRLIANELATVIRKNIPSRHQ